MNATATWTVLGLNCEHCVHAVTEEVRVLVGVTSVDLDLASGALQVGSERPLDDLAVRSAVEAAGYEVER